MAVYISGFSAFGNPGHMASHAVGKGVNGVRQICVDLDVTFKALLGTGRKGLGPRGRHADLVHVMAGGAGTPSVAFLDCCQSMNCWWWPLENSLA